jgi:hypothetical protein
VSVRANRQDFAGLRGFRYEKNGVNIRCEKTASI